MLRLYVAGSNIFYMLNYRNQLIENHRARGTISIVYVFVISHLIIGGLSAFSYSELALSICSSPSRSAASASSDRCPCCIHSSASVLQPKHVSLAQVEK